MKKLIAALSLLFVLSLTACGNSDAALRQENEALRQQILALEAERDNLTKENKDLTEENAALDDTAPESGDDEANPIDRFFEGVMLTSPLPRNSPPGWTLWLSIPLRTSLFRRLTGALPAAVSGASSGLAPTSKSGKTPFISCSMWPRTMPAARIPPCPISFSLT